MLWYVNYNVPVLKSSRIANPVDGRAFASKQGSWRAFPFDGSFWNILEEGETPKGRFLLPDNRPGGANDKLKSTNLQEVTYNCSSNFWSRSL